MTLERIEARGARAAERRAQAVRDGLAVRLGDELPDRISAEVTSGGVRLTGRGIGALFALEPGLRWLLARMRE